jgi:hypothetical protein
MERINRHARTTNWVEYPIFNSKIKGDKQLKNELQKRKAGELSGGTSFPEHPMKFWS